MSFASSDVGVLEDEAVDVEPRDDVLDEPDRRARRVLDAEPLAGGQRLLAEPAHRGGQLVGDLGERRGREEVAAARGGVVGEVDVDAAPDRARPARSPSAVATRRTVVLDARGQQHDLVAG